VRAANNEGVWNDEGLSLPVYVEPPPWRTWWAQALYVLAVGGLALAAYSSQRRKAERAAEYRRQLESEVRARTQELQERNLELQDVNQKLSDASLTDSLTGRRNRRFLFEEVGREISLIQREHHRGKGESAEKLLFIMIDLDGFKPINDAYGHAAGDRVLAEMRRILEQACRTSDVLIRWGGDEFLVVARQADRESAVILPERIRSSVEERRFELGDSLQARLTASIGVAMFPPENTEPASLTLDNIVALADRALYVAKKSGRNAWVCFLGTVPDRSPSGLSEPQIRKLHDQGGLEFRSSQAKEKLVFD
jgi:diguanylate cyclase (GGDEF)-like protein